MKQILAFVAIGFSLSALGQSISPEVIASAGDDFTGGGVQLSWTIGEPIIETVSAGGNIITQGFHQTELTITSIDEENAGNLEVSIYPNPTSGNVIVSVPNNQTEFSIDLYDLNGKLIESKKLKSNTDQEDLDLSNLANSYYLLRLSSEESGYSSTHKVQKTSH